MRALAALGAAAFLAYPAETQGPGRPSPLSRLEHGLWELRDLTGQQARFAPICVSNPTALAQVQHRSPTCTRVVISSDADSATVHYTCPAAGFGRTTIRIETPRLAKIDTQGIYEAAPFGYRLEARRVGQCPSGQSASRR